MEIFPAIDIRNGKVVRLTQGDFNKAYVYSDDPVEISHHFRACGAKNLHVVDLDGAKEGKAVNFEIIKRIMDCSSLSVQIGGGIRSEEGIKMCLDAGAKRVVLGTIAVEDFKFTCRMLEKYEEKIAVGVDAKRDKVALHGWFVESDEKSFEFCEKLSEVGLGTLIYTDISKDGTMSGANLEIYEKLSELKSNVIASGGIYSVEELLKLKQMNIYGAILGKALYEKTLDLCEVMEIC